MSIDLSFMEISYADYFGSSFDPPPPPEPAPPAPNPPIDIDLGGPISDELNLFLPEFQDFNVLFPEITLPNIDLPAIPLPDLSIPDIDYTTATDPEIKVDELAFPNLPSDLIFNDPDPFPHIPVEIVDEPISLTVSQGADVYFKVLAFGEPVLYQWYKLKGSIWIAISSANEDTLYLTNVQSSESYRVKVYNDLGYLLSYANLTVIPTPIIPDPSIPPVYPDFIPKTPDPLPPQENPEIVNILNLSGTLFSKYTNAPVLQFSSLSNPVNTGDLGSVSTGASVHLYKDVNFLLSATDRTANVLTSTKGLVENPFAQEINVDILDISGNTIKQNFISGSHQLNFKITEDDNLTAFSGIYKKDFGVRVSMFDSNSYANINEYYVLGNYLEIDHIFVKDGDGYFFNDNPIDFSSYNPHIEYGNDFFVKKLSNNNMYWNLYSFNINDYTVDFTGEVRFSSKKNESLIIDWGDLTHNSVFEYNQGNNAFSGKDVERGLMPIYDEYFKESLNPNDPGYYYKFSAKHTYPSGYTGEYSIGIYYSGIDYTYQELSKSFKISMPNSLLEKGVKQVGEPTTGKLSFDIKFLNDPIYTKFEKIEVYGSTNSDFLISPFHLIQTIPILNQDQKYSFILDGTKIQPNKNYWFQFAPYSALGKGYNWKIGPYRLYQPDPPKIAVKAEEFLLSNGTEQLTSTLLTGSIDALQTEGTVIDSFLRGEYHTYEYLTQIKDTTNTYSSSKLLLIDNSISTLVAKSGVTLSEYGLSSGSFVNFDVDYDSTGIHLIAKTLNSLNAVYKLHKVSM